MSRIDRDNLLMRKFDDVKDLPPETISGKLLGVVGYYERLASQQQQQQQQQPTNTNSWWGPHMHAK